jgi:pyruvate dehydrogenase E2 component (dihydrolipoamide acetyltransferase)
VSEPPFSPLDGPSAKGHIEVAEPTAAQRSVARRTAEARATVPDVELVRRVEMSAALDRCANEGCSLHAVLVAACAAALRSVPRANGAYRDGRFETYSRVNVGVVVAWEDGYVIPTVFDADTKSPAELTEEIEQLTTGARERTLTSPAFANATFTFWNAGALGVTRSGIVINPPQAGALAAGAVQAEPVVRDGQVVAGQVAQLTLACDHRILYGATAATFLGAVASALQG